MNASPALESAIDKLREVSPDPKDVEKLTADTIQKRDNPHTYSNLFVPGIPMSGTVICKLCGMATAEKYHSPHLVKHPATIHVEWHNAQYRAGVSA